MDKRLLELAKNISKAGKDVARDSKNKDYVIGHGRNLITVTSDSGYEAIQIGKADGSDGHMCLYTNNTERRNSFPSARKIAKLLEAVVNKVRLPEGERKAAYYDWERFGEIEKQLEYFSRVVKNLADLW